MSRWVNGSLEDLLMVSISPRAQNYRPSEPPPRRSEDARHSDVAGVAAHAFRDDLANDALELGVRLLVVESLRSMVPDEPENVGFFTYATSVSSLSEALDRVRARASDSRVVGVLASDTPLGAYMKGLYHRAQIVARALDTFGFQAIDGDGDLGALSAASGEAASFHFVDLRDSIRRDLASLRIEHGQNETVKALREAVEQLFSAATKMDGGRG